ncbi:MAG TPA: hypothetical protein PK191_04595 [Niabella sp.]|nr:hypothetical protein [Niabella sp.]HQX41237.1 hypothetical protein [Niabella sp.]HRB07213.1 hypothetical protein [Niabella sp.]HRB28411.1 hypothetical protein [Niabella sp.]HRB43579.1 hypothetical protein [Niabella sp.]
MFTRLREKWGVGPVRLVFILCTFAVGGSLSGYAGKWLLSLLAISNKALSVFVYFLLVTLIWPIAVISVSLLFGQYPFFKKYLAKMGKRLFGTHKMLFIYFYLSIIS